MNWTATIKALNQDSDSWALIVVYQNGAEQVVKQYALKDISDTIIKELAIKEVAGFTQIRDGKTKVTLAEGSTIDLTPIVAAPSSPSPEDTARRVWLDNYIKLRQLKKAYDAGFNVDIKAIADLENQIKTDFQLAYLDIV